MDSRCSLGREKLHPGIHIRVALQQRPTLTFGQTAPDTELHPVVERVGKALDDNGTFAAHHRRRSLRGSANEEFVGIGGSTPRLRHPRDTGFAGGHRVTFPSVV